MRRMVALLSVSLLLILGSRRVFAQTPISKPTRKPVIQSTQVPTGVPSSEPSHKPSRVPIFPPTCTPTETPIPPTKRPRVSVVPVSSMPTGVPSGHPTRKPTNPPHEPSAEPTTSSRPSKSPKTPRPTNTPSRLPTGVPSRLPVIPSAIPTSLTDVPSSVPSVFTGVPSLNPSVRPSAHPSMLPSSPPSHDPTSDPSASPSVTPPTHDPTTARPSNDPTLAPSSSPSSSPSYTYAPSFSSVPTVFPSNNVTEISGVAALLGTPGIVGVAVGGFFLLLLLILVICVRYCGLRPRCPQFKCCCCFACCCRRRNYDKPDEPEKEDKPGMFACFKRKPPMSHEQKEDLELGEIVLMDVSQLHGRAADKALKKMRKDIDKMYAYMTDRKESMQPLMLERAGINAMVVEQRTKLEGLFSKKDALLAERAPLMEECWEADADVIYEAFNDHFRVDKGALIDVLANRARWQINLISEVFETKYNKSLKDQISTQLTTLFGTIVTGSQTFLCKLLIYRILEQPERDASILEENINDQDVVIELFATRTNQELRHAIQIYDANNVKMFSEVIQTKGYANYKTFMAQALELNRDETLDSFGNAEATALADELYKAGRGRTIGHDPEPFIRVFTRINRYQFESINEAYKKKRLKEDIKKCFGGDFAAVLLSRCGTKYAYLAQRFEQSLKGMKTDKNAICRILGCISRKEGVALREAYDNGQYGRKLETALKTALKKGNFLKACLSVIAGEKNLVADASVFPLGSDREESEDQIEVGRDGDRALQAASQNYNQKKVKELGARQPLNDEFVIPAWDVSVKLYYSKAEDLAVLHEEFVKARDRIVAHKEAMADDVLAKKDTYYAMVKLCTETEAWIRILNGHITALNSFATRRATKFGK